jgi:CBS domain-containing protein
MEAFDRYGASSLAIVDDNNHFLALADRSTLAYKLGDEDDIEAIGTNHFSKAVVSTHHHVWDVLRVMAEYQTDTVAVVDAAGYYIGLIYQSQVVQYLGQSLTVSNPGSIVVLDTDWVGFSMQEVGGIVESNGVRLLGSMVTQQPGSERIYVALKLNEGTVHSVVSALERYGYIVSYTYQPEEQGSNLRNNYEALMRFLNT